MRVIYFLSAYILPTLCLHRCTIRLRGTYLHWLAYAWPTRCIRGTHLPTVPPQGNFYDKFLIWWHRWAPLSGVFFPQTIWTTSSSKWIIQPPLNFLGQEKNMLKKTHLCIDEIFFGEGFSYGVLRWGWVSPTEFRWDAKSSSNSVSFNKANHHPQLPQSHRIGKGLVYFYGIFIYEWLTTHIFTHAFTIEKNQLFIVRSNMKTTFFHPDHGNGNYPLPFPVLVKLLNIMFRAFPKKTAGLYIYISNIYIYIEKYICVCFSNISFPGRKHCDVLSPLPFKTAKSLNVF